MDVRPFFSIVKRSPGKSDYRVVELAQSVDQIQYSPDGNHILARHRAEGENPDTISLYDVKSGTLLKKVGGSSDGLSAQVCPL